jgi:MFS family permease
MTRARVLYALLAVVAAAAAVLSFAALRDLALLCGFGPGLAPLLPVTIDAGAAAGSLAWLAPWTPPAATRYGRALALVLLAASVAGNALGHGLDAYHLAPAWWVVVGVSALAPAVLGALVHLVVLVGRPLSVSATPKPQESATTDAGVGVSAPATVGEWVAQRAAAGEPPAGEDRETAGEPDRESGRALLAIVPPTPAGEPGAGDLPKVAGQLIAAGAGRRVLARELGITEHEARQLIAEHRERA